MGFKIKLIALLAVSCVFLFALDANAQEDLTAVSRESALERIAQLRSEAAAHREMATHFARASTSSRRERRWNAKAVELCQRYISDAEKSIGTYERMLPVLESRTHGSDVTVFLPPVDAPPVTAGEYAARAAQYQQLAKLYGDEAGLHAAMLARLPNSTNRRRAVPGRLPELPGIDVLGRSPEREMRAHCSRMIEDSIRVQRDAQDLAKHYALRAR